MMSDEKCWQRYGGKVVGPEGKTGRRKKIKLTYCLFRFLAVRFSCVLAFALSLSCVWRCVVVNSYRVQQGAGEALQSAQPAAGGGAQLSSRKEGVGVSRPKRLVAKKSRERS